MNKLKTEPSTRRLPRCPHAIIDIYDQRRPYCDNCDVCRTLPVTFRDLLNLRYEDKSSLKHFYEKYSEDNRELLVQYENGETILHWLLIYPEVYSPSRNPLLQHWEAFIDAISVLLDIAYQLRAITNNQGETALHLATKLTQSPQLMRFLHFKYQPTELNMFDNSKNTALFNFLHIGGLAREREAILDICDYTPAEHINEISQIADRLLNSANVSTENMTGVNLLQYVLIQMYKFIRLISYDGFDHALQLFAFYEKFVDQLLNKNTPLCSTIGIHALSFVPTLEIAQKLIDKDSTEINKRGPNGCTPLTNVINRDQFEDKQKIIELMKSKGAEEENKFAVVKNIFDNTPGYNVNMRDPNGATMLINYAANTDIVNKLLQLGADTNITSHQNIDVITSACQSKNIEVLRSLLQSNTALIPNTFALVAVARNYLLSSENCSEWLDIFTRFMNLSSCTGEILINSLPEIVQYGELEKEKLLKLLFAIIKYKNDMFVRVANLPIVFNYVLDLNVYVNPFSWILINMSGYSWYYDLIQSVLDANLPVIKIPDNCINSLTALLLGNVQNKINNCYRGESNKTIEIANSFINRGVNISTSILYINEVVLTELETIMHPMRARKFPNLNPNELQISSENQMFIKNTLHLPDALFIAMITDHIILTEMLLPSWFGPPMALFIFRSWDLSPSIFFMLAKIFTGKLKTKLRFKPVITQDFLINKNVKIDGIGGLVLASERILAAITSGRVVNHGDNPPEICSLRDVSLYAVRMTMAERAARTGERLPDLLEQLSVPPLISKILAFK